MRKFIFNDHKYVVAGCEQFAVDSTDFRFETKPDFAIVVNGPIKKHTMKWLKKVSVEVSEENV